LDFGIAKSDVSSSTTEGAVMGTVRYMAPEQLHDAATAGPTADVYALGAVLYECLSGASPHDGGSVQELMFRILNEEPTRLDRRRPGVPKELADAVQRALAKLPAQRFADVQGFAKAIAPYARAAHTAELDSRCATVDLEQEGRGASSAPRERFGRYSAIVLSGIVGLGVGAALNFPRVARPPKPRIAESAPSAQPRASVVSSSASVPTAASLPPAPFVASAPSASAPTGGSSPAKARPSSGTRPRVVQAQVRFDSENPYGK
jgi:serine/threonine protein kinase